MPQPVSHWVLSIVVFNDELYNLIV